MCKVTTSNENTATTKATTRQHLETSKADADVDEKLSKAVYSFTEPTAENLRIQDHFSSLLFGGSVLSTLLEFALLAAPFIALEVYGEARLNVQGSMTLRELAMFFVVASTTRRVYNAYLEAVFFSFPKLRTQPAKAHRLKQRRDLMGRDMRELEILDVHDKLTMLSQFVLNFGIYYLIPGFYPSADVLEEQTLQERFVRLLLNHYVMSFGMYWAHRSLHVIPWLWENVHSFHHWAKHPLSRNTYEDHWADNFGNAVVGQTFAQILVPLDCQTFWFSRLFRILESLEKHSGTSCAFNIAHSLQQWLPFAQMPHHHDWHHEGFKGSNYTFASLGGIWDCVFGTRKAGRFKANHGAAATREDIQYDAEKRKLSELPTWFSPLLPLIGLSVAVGWKLSN
mmetsp:Transcript_12443/g.18660  ORF Transcript_12443/g.18660 Transcript_12443/m.18660 type:complete len:396 (-) Transcript_12443:351-1538(-)|eukprot:CAMPEP_0196817630 /NCGR_PEP_ID=MMETSP1362-20130617/61788_1 /TAXON_ID=163516 /ORGANISM="Leptocylindrus danicus, Strain CCMP1856" /LENGTH=395 /DNA_ID=CAMNT_0042195411 /DNA_START=191 /DNA_END=1378 /DNA_ORIENTATION=+